jgi:hypothetical protein
MAVPARVAFIKNYAHRFGAEKWAGFENPSQNRRPLKNEGFLARQADRSDHESRANRNRDPGLV